MAESDKFFFGLRNHSLCQGFRDLGQPFTSCEARGLRDLGQPTTSSKARGLRNLAQPTTFSSCKARGLKDLGQPTDSSEARGSMNNCQPITLFLERSERLNVSWSTYHLADFSPPWFKHHVARSDNLADEKSRKFQPQIIFLNRRNYNGHISKFQRKLLLTGSGLPIKNKINKT